MIPDKPSFMLKESINKFQFMWKEYCEEARSDPYFAAVLEYVDRVASTAEEQIVHFNQEFEQAIAFALVHVDHSLLSGDMSDNAMAILTKVWIYGDEMHEWLALKSA